MSDIRADIAALETEAGALHEAVSRTALAAYSSPSDADLRFAADMALATLRDATTRLEQLRAAADLVERQEAEAVEQARQAERDAARDKLVKEHDRLTALADKEYEKFTRAETAIKDATERRDELESLIATTARLIGDRPQTDAILEAHGALFRLEQQLSNFETAIEVETERRDNASDHHLTYEEQAAALAARLAADLLTDEDVASHQAAVAEAAAREDEARRIAEVGRAKIADDMERYLDEQVPVEPTRVLSDVPGIGWRSDGGLVIAVPRRDLDRLAAEKQRCEDEEAARAAQLAADDAARAAREKQRQDDAHAQWERSQLSLAAYARSIGSQNARQSTAADDLRDSP
jgi:hypothetical protein